MLDGIGRHSGTASYHQAGVLRAAVVGKTTNLRWIHKGVNALNRGRLMTLNTRDDRTLFFDLLPIFFKASGLSFRVKVYTVPGQPLHATTREVVLAASDGIAFVADSDRGAAASNEQAYQHLLANMEKLGLRRDRVPVVIQYNKRDLPEAISADELSLLESKLSEPVFAASAIQGDGVMATFVALLKESWLAMDRATSIGQQFGIGPEKFVAVVNEHLSAPLERKAE